MFRKMMLTGAIQIVGTGSSAQMLLAVLICLVHLLLVLRTAPFKSDVDDMLQFLSALSLFLTLQVGMALDSDKTGDVYDRMLLGILLVIINSVVSVAAFFSMITTCPCCEDQLKRVVERKGSNKRL